MAITKRLRFEILRRDGYRCRYCGHTAAEAELRVDHVIPTALGGGDDPDNLVAACEPCNTGKAAIAPDSPIVEDVAADALRWAAAIRRAAELDRQRRSDDHDFVFELLNSYDGAITEQFRRADGNYDIAPDCGQSILKFRDAGLTRDDIVAAAAAMRARNLPDGRRWKYFCGVAWQMIRERQTVARQLIESGAI
ncbi:HNH endonuclease domain protein [Mycolicibacterium canariasense]|uniref:HNH endonuclease domain protein n=1 Tax=Mycolicibacterium canariasense TaxID=228230 RepID=A0A100WA99_MYCCR|nr:HNH endonuclease [Mycolicibacterium canariasense]MCV7208823.1 HNH endonuclease [Mycolicibacterium canariasense]ORV07112.1 hypothetical protein AWB94_14010 [Mycolicibacterium canariasense]GAS94389.1 HNH endonuclease domain protein [Mycolicibacterium canariasense]